MDCSNFKFLQIEDLHLIDHIEWELISIDICEIRIRDKKHGWRLKHRIFWSKKNVANIRLLATIAIKNNFQ